MSIVSGMGCFGQYKPIPKSSGKGGDSTLQQEVPKKVEVGGRSTGLYFHNHPATKEVPKTRKIKLPRRRIFMIRKAREKESVGDVLSSSNVEPDGGIGVFVRRRRKTGVPGRATRVSCDR